VFCYHRSVKPYICYNKNGFRLYPSRTLQGEAAVAFLRFAQDYLQALARRYGERPRLRLEADYLEADLSSAPRTLRATRYLVR
jgi:hypothetical protein